MMRLSSSSLAHYYCTQHVSKIPLKCCKFHGNWVVQVKRHQVSMGIELRRQKITRAIYSNMFLIGRVHPVYMFEKNESHFISEDGYFTGCKERIGIKKSMQNFILVNVFRAFYRLLRALDFFWRWINVLLLLHDQTCASQYSFRLYSIIN